MRRIRIARICISLAVMAAVTAAVAAGCSIWLQRMQIVPALLSCSLAWLLLWTAATALLGRIYCSTACPMGTLQDVFTFFSRRRRRGFFYSAPRPALRWCIAIMALAAMAAGIAIITGLLDPYSAYCRIVAYLVAPVFRPVALSVAGAAVALLTLAAVAIAALLRGRLLCNTLCPVGTLLGALSRYSLYHVDIDTDRCIGCNRCVSRCKAECINPADHTVDLSRCVVCFDCLTDCPSQAITFRRGRHQLKMPMLQEIAPAKPTAISQPDKPAEALRTLNRRKFLAALAGAAAALPVAGALRPGIRPINYPTPPGSASRADYLSLCAACGACAAACPSGAIKPSAGELGLRYALVPLLDYDAGPCRYNCEACTRVCPTGALQPLTPGEKHRFVIGKARLDATLCLLYEYGEGCGECARRCPIQAITIVATADGRRRPSVDFDRCIGCGECQWVCPARPRAFVVEGE